LAVAVFFELSVPTVEYRLPGQVDSVLTKAIDEIQRTLLSPLVPDSRFAPLLPIDPEQLVGRRCGMNVETDSQLGWPSPNSSPPATDGG
jgi:hypothetical protein